jgi:hypothetical protein
VPGKRLRLDVTPSALPILLAFNQVRGDQPRVRADAREYPDDPRATAYLPVEPLQRVARRDLPVVDLRERVELERVLEASVQTLDRVREPLSIQLG